MSLYVVEPILMRITMSLIRRMAAYGGNVRNGTN